MSSEPRSEHPAAAAFFAALAPALRDIAREHGYALAVHGSMATDLDLMAMPWVESASTPDELAVALASAVGCDVAQNAQGEIASERPHGRLSYSISLKGPAFWSIPKQEVHRPLANVWIDLSVMPRLEDR